MSATVYAKVAATGAQTGHGALTATAKATEFKLTAALSGHGVLSAVAYNGSFGALTGHGALSATVYAKVPATTAPAGHGALSATVYAKVALTAPLTGHGVLSATAAATEFKLAATAAGHGVLTAWARVVFAVETPASRTAVIAATYRTYQPAQSGRVHVVPWTSRTDVVNQGAL